MEESATKLSYKYNFAYRCLPNEIKEMCNEILIDWKNEIEKPVNTFGRTREPHKGNHILLSLGHPYLEEIAMETAIRIKEEEFQSPGQIPEHLLEAVTKIIDIDEFPVWNSIYKDEQE